MLVRHLARTIAVLLAASVALAAPAAPAAAGKLKKPPLARRIDAVMREWTGQDRPGCAVGVVQGGKLIHDKGYGMADLERGVPIGPATVFDVGSVSKQFTAAAIHLLVADGKLGLDDGVRKHVPELPAYASPITLRHLLHHTAGLRDYTTLLPLAGAWIADRTTTADALAAITRQKALVFPPGSRHAYSNSGYFLLGVIAERVSGSSLAALLQARVFGPLGMTRTHVHDDSRALVPGRALAYAPARQGAGWALDLSDWEQAGDGAVLTTVGDLARWDANFDAPRVGGQALLDALLARGTLADGTALDYASGLVHDTYRDKPVVRHAGGWAGYRAELLRFPTERTSVIVLCNAASSDPIQLAQRIADEVLWGGPVAAAANTDVTLPVAELDRWVGRYRGGGLGTFEVRREGTRLVTHGGPGTLHLVATGEATFRLVEAPAVTVRFAGAPGRRTLELRTPDRPLVMTELTPRPLPADEARALVGRYWNDELEVFWTIALDASGAPVLHAPGSEPVVLVGVDVDRFDLQGATLVAQRKAKQGVVALDLELEPGWTTRFTRR